MGSAKIYRRLASAHRFGVGSGGWSTLYLGPDHLLLRSTNAFVETYRRFYFRDIEAITLCKTLRGYLWNGAFGFLLFFFCVAFFYLRGWFSGSAAVILLVALLINLARGPTSRASLQTRVQTRPLPLVRLRSALKLIRMLEEKIAAAQADLPVVETPPLTPRSIPPAPPRMQAIALPPPLSGQTRSARWSWVHLVTFSLLVVGGLLCLSEARQHRPGLFYWALGVVGLNLAWGLAALVRQRFVPLPSPVISIAWINLALHALGVPAVYFAFFIFYAMRAVEATRRQQVPPAQMRLSDLPLMPGYASILFSYALICVTLGAVGYLLMMIYRWKPSQPRAG